MYLWKCWRDTRILFFVWIAAAMLFADPYHWNDRFELYGLATASLMGGVLLSWASYEGFRPDTYPFVFTRPRSRGYFVWMAWLVAGAELVVGFLIAIAADLALLHWTNATAWSQLRTFVSPLAG